VLAFPRAGMTTFRLRLLRDEKQAADDVDVSLDDAVEQLYAWAREFTAKKNGRRRR